MIQLCCSSVKGDLAASAQKQTASPKSKQSAAWPVARADAHLCGSICMQIIIVGDELHGGVPDVLGRELARSLYKRDHHICVPLKVWEEPADEPRLAVSKDYGII